MRGKPRLLVLFVIILWATASFLPPAAGLAEAVNPQDIQPTTTPTSDTIHIQAHLISADEGWLLLDEDLFWTQDGGGSWLKITPPGTDQASISAVTFLDTHSGWALLTSEDAGGFPVYQLAQTADRGATWQTFPLSLFDPGDVSALAQNAYLDFIDPVTGWLVIKRSSSSNFSLGALFKTLDGGRTWTRLTIPIGDPVYFINANAGWVAGGADGSQLYSTQDGGLTWAAQNLPAPADGKRLYQLPSFKNAQEGILPAATNTASGSQLDLFTTQDGGQTWVPPAAGITLDQPLAPGTAPTLSMLDGSSWIMVEEDHQQVLRSENGIQDNLATTSGALPGTITALDMVDTNHGWAQTAAGDCQPASGTPDALACTHTAGLLKTADGGQTWAPLSLPQPSSGASLQSNTPPGTGQGWDTCSIPSIAQMQTWLISSPYRFWNLYFGGSSMANCGNLTANYISQLTLQGWKFNPTWVGPQAPTGCWTYPSTMSTDLSKARLQGIAEANAAVERAASLQLTKPDKTGAIIYYDLEAYDTSNSKCRNAVKSFMDGWVAQLHARGDQAAVYGTGCFSALSDFAANANVPDAIWAAQYPSPSQFRSDATVWDISCLPNNLWSEHQRLHQYAGGHNETWGGVTINVDSSVADGILLDLSAGPRIHITAPADNTWLHTGQVLVTVAPASPGESINHVDFQWHSPDWSNSSSWTTIGTDTNGSNGWSILFDNNNNILPNGQGGAIYAWAYDSAGNRSGAGVWNLGIDHIPPALSVITSPTYDDSSPFRDFYVDWSSTDTMPGIVQYNIQYQVDSTTGAWTNLVTGTTDTENHFVGQYNHTYYFRGQGLDSFNNLSSYTDPVSYSVGSQPPSHPDAYEADKDNTSAAANVISVDGSPQMHNFNVEGDVDWIKFVADGKSAYVLQTNNIGGYADTMIYLYARDATTQLAFNDDFPGLNLASLIVWKPDSAGTYYIKVVPWDPYACGDTTEYTLSVTYAYQIIMPKIAR